VGDYTDTDTIGLVVAMVAVLAVLIVGKVQQRKTEPMQFSPKIILGKMRESGGDRNACKPNGVRSGRGRKWRPQLDAASQGRLD
jgi:hypothetical protein